MIMVRFMLACGTLVVLTQAVSAQTTIDVTKITCEQYQTFKVADPQKIAIWLSGYYHGQKNDPVLEPQQLDAYAKKLMTLCFSNQTTPIMKVIEKTFLPQ
jgi:acid stress chaperone HdeB